MRTTLTKALWVAALVLLVLCLRININRTLDGAITCMDPKNPETTWRYGCEDDRMWSVSLKFPWRRW